MSQQGTGVCGLQVDERPFVSGGLNSEVWAICVVPGDISAGSLSMPARLEQQQREHRSPGALSPADCRQGRVLVCTPNLKRGIYAMLILIL